tara:strand:+ start:5859 stop:6422 length:564 start_codon:yes stop_codon:yes gene_type:complete
MTLILAVIKDGIGYMAGDMCVTQGNSEKLTTTEKVFEKSGVLIGCCGSFRVINCIYNKLNLKHIVNTAIDVDDLAFAFCDELHRLGVKHGFLKITDSEAELAGGSEILLVYKNSIISVGQDLSYVVLTTPYAAIGVPDHAEGVIFSGYKKSDPHKLIDKAMKLTASANAGVSTDYILLQEEQSDENT